MVFTFFVYGLSFFVLGTIVYVYPKKNTQLKLADHLWLLALFGITHGVNEWLDMFILIAPEQAAVLGDIRMLILPISFFFLVQFGMHNVVKIKKTNAALKLIPFCLLACWMIITGASSQRLLIGDIAARYLLCVPGTLLTAYTLILHLPDYGQAYQPAHLHRLMKLTAGSFLSYGFFSGIIVPEAWFFPASIVNYKAFLDTLGVPIQFFRTFCAVLTAYAVTRILSIFEWETIYALRKAHDDLENNVRMRTASLQELNLELREALDKAKKT